MERNPLFYDGTLTAATYRAWLRNWGVRYVVLPSDEPDGAGLAESKLITSGSHSWLLPVWHDAHWRLFRVTGTQPLADAPATVTHAGSADLTVHVPAAGSYLLRIPYSPGSASRAPRIRCTAACRSPERGPGSKRLRPGRTGSAHGTR